MSEQKHNNKPDSEILKQFPESEQNLIREVWKKSGDAVDAPPEFTRPEIERALDDVHTRLEMSGEMSSAGDKIAGWIQRHHRILVAAVALIAVTSLFLFVPKTASVSYGEIATLEMPDGSTIEMNSGTTVRFSRLYPFTNRHIELNGEAFFTVEVHSNPFIVEANGTFIEVTGTRFNIRSWSDDPGQETSVTVSNGQVLFYTAQDRTGLKILQADESSFWNLEMDQPSEPEPAAADDALAWREYRFVFQNQTILSILRDLERRYDVEIELAVPEVAFSTLTAYYSQNVHIETILEDICTVKGLRFTETANGYRIFD